jgi:hypothetical protein
MTTRQASSTIRTIRGYARVAIILAHGGSDFQSHSPQQGRAPEAQDPNLVLQTFLHTLILRRIRAAGIPGRGACTARRMRFMHMQEKFNNARGIIYMIGLAVLVVLLAWKFVVR